MKKIFFTVLLITDLFSKSLDTYRIEIDQIETIRYLGNEQIVINLKEKYWENFFDFTRKNLSKKVIIEMDTIHTTPYIFSPLYDTFELTSTSIDLEKISKNFKLLLSKKKRENKEILENKKKIFLNKMLKKYTNDDFLRAELIALYHREETTTASKKCIELYEEATEEMKLEIVTANYNNIFDCYLDLNKTTKVLEFLSFVKKEIKENGSYEILEQEAYVYTLVGQPKKARKIYEEALKVLKETDFSKELIDPDEIIIQKVKAMKKSEIKRLETMILDLSGL